MSSIYLFASLSVGGLFTIYGNSVANCIIIKWWLQGTQAMIDSMTINHSKERYIQLPQTTDHSAVGMEIVQTKKNSNNVSAFKDDRERDGSSNSQTES